MRAGLHTQRTVLLLVQHINIASCTFDIVQLLVRLKQIRILRIPISILILIIVSYSADVVLIRNSEFILDQVRVVVTASLNRFSRGES